MATIVVTADALYAEFKRVLDKAGFAENKSILCARTFVANSRDGINSHGINRFPGLIDYVRRGVVDPAADPRLLGSFGALERWDGARGVGIVNAHFCMDRAITLAGQSGVGCVALRNTNHWMRGGTYGLQAADAGCIGLCWTNTQVLMPPWGGKTPKLGNNPLVVCVPRDGGHVLLDMAMSQFSLGRLLIAAKAGEFLPIPGGFDDGGAVTNDPAVILRTKRPLPIGFWKGSGLALLLDCVVSMLSGGQATFQIGSGRDETNISQMFLAIDLERTGSAGDASGVVDAIIADLRSAEPAMPGRPVTFPGEQMAERRRTNDAHGIPVDSEIWGQLRAL
jgi:3-dehydro-L-gulonate 2-dehydrogenase